MRKSFRCLVYRCLLISIMALCDTDRLSVRYASQELVTISFAFSCLDLLRHAMTLSRVKGGTTLETATKVYVFDGEFSLKMAVPRRSSQFPVYGAR